MRPHTEHNRVKIINLMCRFLSGVVALNTTTTRAKELASHSVLLAVARKSIHSAILFGIEPYRGSVTAFNKNDFVN